MSVSTDGQICYGIRLDEDEMQERENWDDEEWAEQEWEHRERLSAEGYELLNVCSDGYGIYILAVKETVMRARRGVPERFDPAALAADTAWDEDLVATAADYGFPVAEDPAPGWYLSSYTDAF